MIYIFIPVYFLVSVFLCYGMFNGHFQKIFGRFTVEDAKNALFFCLLLSCFPLVGIFSAYCLTDFANGGLKYNMLYKKKS